MPKQNQEEETKDKKKMQENGGGMTGKCEEKTRNIPLTFFPPISASILLKCGPERDRERKRKNE